MTETKKSTPAAPPRSFRRSMIGDVLYQPIVAQYDRRHYGDEAVRALLAANGHEEELTEFQACVAMGETHQAMRILQMLAEQIKPRVLQEAKREATSATNAERKKAAAETLKDGHVSEQMVSPWVRIALRECDHTLWGHVDKKGDLHQALCRYFSHTNLASNNAKSPISSW